MRPTVRRTLTAAMTAVLVTAGLVTAGPATAATAALASGPAATRVSLTPGLRGFDSLGVETPAQIACLSNGGYSFDLVDVIGTAWESEYDAAAAAGMSVVLFQGYDPSTWPSTAQGTARGQIVAQKAAAKGYPKGAQIFLNVENNRNASAATAIGWVQNWAKAVKAAGYVPGVYVGVPQVLSAAQLTSSLPDVAVFWRSASGSAPQTSRGYAVRQSTVSTPACGIAGGIDIDSAGRDTRGQVLVGAGFPRVATAPTDAGAYVPMTPLRLLDTRSSTAVRARGSVKLRVTNRAGAPATAAAVAVNLTAIAPAGTGHLTAYNGTGAAPGVYDVILTPGRSVSNLVIVPVAADGTITVANVSSGATQLVVDLHGYYRSGSPTVGGTFKAVSPALALDTRSGAAVAAGGSISARIAGRASVPAATSGVVLTVTALSPTGYGHLVAYPSGTRRPGIYHTTFVPGQTVTSSVTTTVGAGGTVMFANVSSGTVHIIVDVLGYYLPTPSHRPGTFVPVTPAAVFDTRAVAALPAAAGRAQPVTGRAGIPATGVSAIAGSLVVANQTASGYAALFPTAQAVAPGNLNLAPRLAGSTMVQTAVGPDGDQIIYNGSGAPAQFILDVAGYFAG